MKRFIIIAALALVIISFVTLIGLAGSLEFENISFDRYIVYSIVALAVGGISIKVLSFFDPDDLN